MADIFYNQGKADIVNGAIDLLTDTLKVLLVTSSYTADADNTVVDAGGANDVIDHELNVTGYTRGWGGSGRKTLASKAVNTNNTSDRAEFDAADITWTGLATGQTIAAAIMVKEGVANDTTSRLIAYFDLTDTPTNGGDFTIQWAAAGLLNF